MVVTTDGAGGDPDPTALMVHVADAAAQSVVVPAPGRVMNRLTGDCTEKEPASSAGTKSSPVGQSFSADATSSSSWHSRTAWWGRNPVPSTRTRSPSTRPVSGVIVTDTGGWGAKLIGVTTSGNTTLDPDRLAAPIAQLADGWAQSTAPTPGTEMNRRTVYCAESSPAGL